jgi:hypothetical protein
MGPGIAAEPHCAETGFAGVRSVRECRSEERCSHPSRSWRARSGVASVSVGCPVSRALPRAFSRRTLRSLPRPPGSASSPDHPRQSEDSCGRSFPAAVSVLVLSLSPSTSLRKRPSPASVRSDTCFPVRSWQARLHPFSHRLSVRGPSWDLRLSRCPDQLLRACPACGGETNISSGASCRLRSGDPPSRSDQASWGSPTLAK